MYATFGDDRLRVWSWQGVEFPISHRLALSPLQHSCTTMQVCVIRATFAVFCIYYVAVCYVPQLFLSSCQYLPSDWLERFL